MTQPAPVWTIRAGVVLVFRSVAGHEPAIRQAFRENETKTGALVEAIAKPSEGERT